MEHIPLTAGAPLVVLLKAAGLRIALSQEAHPVSPPKGRENWFLTWTRVQHPEGAINMNLSPVSTDTFSRLLDSSTRVLTSFLRVLLVVAGLFSPASLASAAAFVQQNYVTPQTPQGSVSVTYNSGQTVGNTNVLVIGWNDTTSNITSVTDSAGNAYQVAVPTFRSSGMSQAIYDAPNIAGAAAGSNTVTVTFSQAAVYVDLRIAEYSGLVTTSPFDVGASATSATSGTANSGSVTTNASNELIIGCGMTSDGFSGAGTSFTQRVITIPDGDILEDRSVSATGSYSATAPVSGAWVMQIATFKASGASDTTPPTVSVTSPLSGTFALGTVSVNATAADNVGVTGVQFLLDGTNLGAEDTTSPYSVSWNTTTASNGSHSLSARARDAAGNSTTSTPVTVTVDNQAPTGTILINNGAAATNVRAVTLNLSASDALGAVTQMRFSNTGTSFNTPVAYAVTAPWTLTTGTGTKTVFAQFKDAAGNWSVSATDTIVLDTTAPTVTNRTATNITATSATITWTTNEAADSQVDYGLTTSYGATTALDSNLVISHSVLISGLNPSTPYNYRVRSRDAAGNLTLSANSSFTTVSVSDTIPPDTTIVSSPANPSSSTSAALTFSGTDSGSGVGSFQCQLDAGAFAACTSPKSYTSLGDGSHTFQVKAIDNAGNQDLSPASYTWVIDATGPTTTIGSTPPNPTNSAFATFAFSAVDAGSGVASFECKLDAGSFAACSSPVNFTSLSAGSHTFQVRAIDNLGNVGSAQSYTWVVNGAPTITPAAVTRQAGSPISNSTIATVNDVESGAGGVTVAVTSANPFNGVTVSNIVNTSGAVTANVVAACGATAASFTLTATDGGGLTATATIGVTVNPNTAPTLTYNSATVQVAGAATVNPATGPTDNGSIASMVIQSQGTYLGTISVNSAGVVSMSGATPIGSHTITIRATDNCGATTDTTLALNVIDIIPPDTTPPTVAITAPVANSTVSGTVVVTADAVDAVGVVGVQFLVDGANLSAEDTTSPYSISWNTTTASNGLHTLSARARDAAGNTNTSSLGVTVSNTQLAGLALGYSFDEAAGAVANDSSGNGNTATLNNGVARVPGRYGSAVSLDGVNDYLAIPNSTSTNISGTGLTLSTWINPQSLSGGDSVVIGKFWNTTWTAPNYQYGIELDGGTTPHFYVGTTGGLLGAQMGGPLPISQWSNLAVVFNGTQVQFYLNGVLVNALPVSTSITARGNVMNVGADERPGQFFKGLMDDLRIYNRALSPSEVQSDMNTPLGSAGSSDPTPPTVFIVSPAAGALVSDIVTVTADAFDNVGVGGVQFYVDGVPTGAEDTTDPYGLNWDTRTSGNGAHTLTALARDAAGNATLSAPVTVNVANTNFFQNEVLATGFNLPTAIRFLPDGRLLIVELAGKIKVLPSPYTTPSPPLFLQLTNVGSAGVQQGIYDITLDPNFISNHFYYIFYTLGSPNHDRLSRFTANATLDGTVPGSEFVLYEDPQIANAEHHGGAINFGNDGKIYFTTGEHFTAGDAQLLASPRGKIHRINPDGSVPTDNPFYDGAGPNWDSIWALGLRNPYRAYFDAPTNKLYIGDVGGNDYSTAIEEVDVGIRGANYGWPNCELGTCGNPNYTAAIYAYPHLGRDSAITGGFVYHGSQYPASYQGSYFFADYTQNWIRRLTFDAQGNVNGVFNFEPADGSVDGPYGDIVYLTEGPDGALYYVDLGYSDISGQFGISKIRRIRFVQSNLPPTAIASVNPAQGPVPLTVNFSSAGSVDPEGQPLTYSWTFGDGATSIAANPVKTYVQAGQYTARLTVSDGVNNTIGAPITISVGSPPTPTMFSPIDGALFVAGDVIPFSGDATDTEDGVLPASSFTWNIDFLHEGHVHPGIPITGVKSGTFTIPTSGHDFSGFTRYRFMLTVTDSNGLQTAIANTVYPTKITLSFDTAPTGLTLYLDGIVKTTPFVYDTLMNFQHSIEARNASTATTTYTFQSWSDGGAQTHTITVPASAQSYTATYGATPNTTPITMGETAVLGSIDNGNGNFLLVQNATLSQSATIQSLSFYVTTASGSLRLGVYDATGPGGGPGALKAQTNAFTPVLGWNTANVITPVSLPAGDYWLAYLPSSSSLNFAANFSIGSFKYASFNFGPMPATFPAVVGQGTTHWSLYGTLTP